HDVARHSINARPRALRGVREALSAARLAAGWALVAGVAACGSDRTLLHATTRDAAESPFRAAAGLDRLPGQLTLPARFRLVPAFPGVSFDDPVALLEAPGTGQLVVSERKGKLYAFENRADVSTKHLVLDLSAHVQGDIDSGLLGVAFHPEFADAASPNRGYMYVHYAFRETPITQREPPANTRTRSRLARFTVDVERMRADPASELVLIDQEDESLLHQGGALFFHPGDGFLYVSVGDEGRSRCLLANCQR